METTGTLSSIEFGAWSYYFLFYQLISYHSCMEHLFHLAACHVLSQITPMRTEKRPLATIDNEDDNYNISVGNAISDDCSTILSQGLGKLLGLIKQVCDQSCLFTFSNESVRYESHLKPDPSSSACVTRSTSWSSSLCCLYKLVGAQCLHVWIGPSHWNWCVFPQHSKIWHWFVHRQ